MREPRIQTLRNLAAATGLSILALTATSACAKENRSPVLGNPVVRNVPPTRDQTTNISDQPTENQSTIDGQTTIKLNSPGGSMEVKIPSENIHDGSTGKFIIEVSPNILSQAIKGNGSTLFYVTPPYDSYMLGAQIIPIDRRTIVASIAIGNTNETRPRDQFDSLPESVRDIADPQTLAANWTNWRITQVELNKQPMRRNPNSR